MIVKRFWQGDSRDRSICLTLPDLFTLTCNLDPWRFILIFKNLSLFNVNTSSRITRCYYWSLVSVIWLIRIFSFWHSATNITSLRKFNIYRHFGVDALLRMGIMKLGEFGTGNAEFWAVSIKKAQNTFRVRKREAKKGPTEKFGFFEWSLAIQLQKNWLSELWCIHIMEYQEFI